MLKLEDYNYHLPQELIANSPASPRDSARLFVYNTATDEIAFDTFAHIDRYLPTPSLLVFNNTKVVPARLWLTKETGGKIEVLLMMNEYRPNDALIRGVVDRKILAGAVLSFKSGATLTAVKQEGQFFFFKPDVAMPVFWDLLMKEGVTPIPPYIKGATLSETVLREKYQSILAKHPASIAAPTASLHFTNRLLNKLEQKGVRRTEITLHVGAGTFAPIGEENFRTKKLFTEYIEVTTQSADTINHAKTSGIPIIPVGTTAMRTLESVARHKCQGLALTSWSGATNIFIYPPYKFNIADALITNFHVPKSSLLLLVDALLKHKKAKRNILELYDIAIKEKFRFYSFGDGMLIL
jgi:S-adenosylmethionine:tRNA ribosyltransferase-isomerase